MSEAPAPTDAEDALLAELAQMDMALARRVHAMAVAATDTDDINSLSRTYQRISRSLRQTLALKAKLRDGRIRAAAAYAETPAAIAAEKKRVKRRVDELHGAIERVAWTECETERPDPDEMSEAEEMVFTFWQMIDDLRADPDFGLEPLDDQLQEFAARLGLSPEGVANWRDLPVPDWPADDDDDEDDDEDEDEPPRRSSA